jgi:hypothetical protein
MPCLNPFPFPEHLDPDLQRVVSLWKRLRRAENDMPFADDLKFSDLSKLSAKTFVLSVFVSPERFRLEFPDKGPKGAAMAGLFIDEISLDNNFSYLRAQSSATLEAAEPTFLRLSEHSGRDFCRVLLPMWGNGQINTLLGALSS